MGYRRLPSRSVPVVRNLFFALLFPAVVVAAPVPKAASATVTVKNEAGAVVYSQQKSFTSGVQEFVWNGKKTDGTAAPDGTYTISFDAKDSAGNAVKPSAEVTGKVTALDFTSGQPYLLIDGMSISVWSVKSVTAAN